MAAPRGSRIRAISGFRRLGKQLRTGGRATVRRIVDPRASSLNLLLHDLGAGEGAAWLRATYAWLGLVFDVGYANPALRQVQLTLSLPPQTLRLIRDREAASLTLVLRTPETEDLTETFTAADLAPSVLQARFLSLRAATPVPRAPARLEAVTLFEPVLLLEGAFAPPDRRFTSFEGAPAECAAQRVFSGRLDDRNDAVRTLPLARQALELPA